MPWFLNPTAIGSFVLAVVLSGLGGMYYGHKAGARSVQQQWDHEKAQIAQAVADELTRIRAKESALQLASDQLQKENKDARKTIVDRDVALRDSLRKRPSRIDTASMSSDSCSAIGVSGERLARGDAEFLAGYSADAARVAAALSQCERQYNEVLKTACTGF